MGRPWQEVIDPAMGPARAEDEDRSGERVFAKFVLHQRRQTVMTFSEVDGLRRHHDAQPVRGEAHADTASASAIAGMRLVEALRPRANPAGTNDDCWKQAFAHPARTANRGIRHA